jgi:hypothetical protein
VFFECKNYGSDPANPELDQMIGRFGNKRTEFGIIVCRNIANEALMLQRCKDAMLQNRGWILLFDDVDVKQLLQFRSEDKPRDINRFLHEKMRQLIM